MTMPGVNKGYSPYSDSGSAIQYSGRKISTVSNSSQYTGRKISTASTISNGHSSDQMSDIEDGPTYLLEHLATFSVGRQQNIVDPTDGLNRLWQMEKRSGIWTQKMQMKLTKQWVVIIDYENGDIVERFPMQMISSPMAYTGSDPNELYNNILIFIVKEDPKRKNLNPSEMHIFQCVQVPGQEIVKDLNLFMSGKWKSGYKSELLPPPPTTPAPEPPINGNMNRQRISTHEMGNYNNSIDETSSTGSERYEKEVGILNHCFDDIEQFIAWLQSSAAAYRELERRRADRKSKKKDHGDGMLSMRAKPPPERDFVDVLQKFKLSFNLLAKLKAHIHDPNAPELVHFLFTPLALIVDASRESNYGQNLASRVVSPLLTKEAVELLANCLTSKESDLWHSLGEAWVVPRDHWKGYVAQYHPTFRDGYSPEYPFNEGREQAITTAIAAANVAMKTRHSEIVAAQHEADARGKGYGGYYPPEPERIPSPDERQFLNRTQSPHSDHEYKDMKSDISADSIERPLADPQKQVQQWLDELKMKDAKIVQVIFPRSANNEKELTVFRGEFLEVLDDGRKWWKARNIRGQIGHVPHTIVTSYNLPYNGDDDNVSLNPTYVRNGAYKSDSEISGERPPSRPPPIPPPAPAPAEFVRQERQGKREEVKPVEKKEEPKRLYKQKEKEVHDDFNAELKETIHKGRKPRTPLRRLKLPPIYINEDSTAEDVQRFLESKNFDEGIRKTFKEIAGKEVFSLKREQLEKYCGKEEGARLLSQITLQKSFSGYRTVKGTELLSVLEKMRQKNDEAPPPEPAPTTANGDVVSSRVFEFLESEEDDDNDENVMSAQFTRLRRPNLSSMAPPPPPPPMNGNSNC